MKIKYKNILTADRNMSYYKTPIYRFSRNAHLKKNLLMKKTRNNFNFNFELS